MSHENPVLGAGIQPDPAEPAEGDTGTPEQPSGTERTYTSEEYSALKDESIRNRIKAKEVDTLKEALRDAYLRLGTAGILHDPTSLEWSEEFNEPETGLPDPDRIREAAERLADEKPWLARARGDVGQGVRGDQTDAPVDLAGLLRGEA